MLKVAGMKRLWMITALLALAPVSAFARDCDSVKVKAAKFVDYMDTDRDGVISGEEYEMGTRKRFTDADTDRDGVLSRKEVLEAKKREMAE